MNTIKELTQQEKYNTMLKRKNKEIKSLKEQLEYLRSNEYLNQVKWERDFNEKVNDDLTTEIQKALKEKLKLLEEIERLNNIINEFEKWLEQEYAVVKANSIQEPNNLEWYIKWNERKNTFDKLQELKEK